MTDGEEVAKTKHKRLQERACGQKYRKFVISKQPKLAKKSDSVS
jgi:hypothetical protein